MSVSVTLTFETLADAADALASMLAPPQRIAHEDRPDVGAPAVEPPVAAPPTFNPFVVPAAEVAVVPVPPPSVPTPPVVATPPTAATVPTVALPAAPGSERDSAGLPWDGRIHATSAGGAHPTVADGTWRKKRGVDDATVAKVEAELRAALGASAPAEAAVVPVVPTVPVPPVTPSPVTSAAVPVPPSTTAVSPVVSPAPAADAITFSGLMARIAPTITKTPGANDIMAAILHPFGLTAVGQLITVAHNDPPLFNRIAGELSVALGVA